MYHRYNLLFHRYIPKQKTVKYYEMPNVRPLNEKKYGISKYAFIMARAYSLRYDEWKEALTYTDDTDLLIKIRTIEDTVLEATEGQKAMYPYLLKYVTQEKSTYDQMLALGMPYGSTLFYERRRKYYYLLSKKI